MTRLQQARHLAGADPYWRAYLDGLDDKHRVRSEPPSPEQLAAIQDRINATHAKLKAQHIAFTVTEPPEAPGVSSCQENDL